MDKRFFREWTNEIARLIDARRDDLTRLDQAIGDGDHGTNLTRGFSAALDTLTAGDPPTPGEVLSTLGRALISNVGGASGPLYGTAFRRTGRTIGDVVEVDLSTLHHALEAGLQGVRQLGGASAGDKTMVDAFIPALAAMGRAIADGLPAEEVFEIAAVAAEEGSVDTMPMMARKGRASYLGERSIGHQDPGSLSTALIFVALRNVGGS